MKYILTLLCLLPSLLQAQIASPEFYVRGVSYSEHLNLYTAIPYSKLTFEATPDGFTARYRVHAEIARLDSNKIPENIMIAPVWEQSVTEELHANTIAHNQTDLSVHSVELPPGIYFVSTTLTDLNASSVYFQEILTNQRDYSKPVAISDLVLLAGFDPESQSIVPHLSPDVNAGNHQIYYEVYSDTPQTLLINRLLTSPPHPTRTWTDTLHIYAGRHQHIAPVPAGNLQFRQYDIVVSLQSLNGDILDQSIYSANVGWNDLGRYLKNLSEAIEQLSYIAAGNELRTLKNAESFSEQKALFDAFWKKRDPTLGTIRNEAMEEHYYRIDYSNQNFGQQLPGWQSDRGHVFILHGHPDEVQRQTFQYNSQPWEVWYYFGIGRQFMFVDQTGLGDFELVLPVWDERTRI